MTTQQAQTFNGDKASEILGDEDLKGATPISFCEVKDEKGFFRAELATDKLTTGSKTFDLIFHFYPVEGTMTEEFWRGAFSEALEKSAVSFFNMSYPDIKADYVEEMTAYWMRVYGIGNGTQSDIDYAKSFVEVLSEAVSSRAV